MHATLRPLSCRLTLLLAPSAPASPHPRHCSPVREGDLQAHQGGPAVAHRHHLARRGRPGGRRGRGGRHLASVVISVCARALVSPAPAGRGSMAFHVARARWQQFSNLLRLSPCLNLILTSHAPCAPRPCRCTAWTTCAPTAARRCPAAGPRPRTARAVWCAPTTAGPSTARVGAVCVCFKCACHLNHGEVFNGEGGCCVSLWLNVARAPAGGGLLQPRGNPAIADAKRHFAYATNHDACSLPFAGSLEEVPSQSPDVAFPKRPLVDSYPVEVSGAEARSWFRATNLAAILLPHGVHPDRSLNPLRLVCWH